MGLEKYYLGDEAFARFSKVFAADWDEFPHKDALLKLVGDIELARPIAHHLGSDFSEWLHSNVPALDDITPMQCLCSKSGIRRLKSCLMRMP
jgi:hypothetical protein